MIAGKGQDTQRRTIQRSGGTTEAQEEAEERGTTTTASTSTNTDATDTITVRSGAKVAVVLWSGPVKEGNGRMWRKGGVGSIWSQRGRDEPQRRLRGERGRKRREIERREEVRQGRYGVLHPDLSFVIYHSKNPHMVFSPTNLSVWQLFILHAYSQLTISLC